MKYSTVIAFIFLLHIPPIYTHAQDQEQLQSEFIWGINENTAGWLIGGGILKKSIPSKRNKRVFRTYGMEIVNVRHPQESRVRALTGNFFIYGKSNYLYALRLQYGRDMIFFRKAEWSGVSIKGVLAVGPTIGIVSPYYIQWQSSFRDVRHEAYDPKNPFHSYSRILGPGFLLEGLGESRIQMGGNLKIGLSFDLGVSRQSITGFEVGFLLDAYFDDVEMLPLGEQRSIFPTGYLTLFYGRRK